MPDDQPTALDFDSPAFLADPYPALAALRARDPVHLSPWGDWYLTRFEDVAAMLGERRFRGTSPEGRNPLLRKGDEASAFGRLASRWMVFMDAPEHTQLRGLVGRYFSRERIDGLRVEIEGIVERLLEGPREAGALELVAELAYPLPAMVVSRILGMPDGDHLRFRDAFALLTRAVDRGDIRPGGEAQEIDALLDYFRGLAVEKRARPGADLTSFLVAAGEGRDGLPVDCMLATCVFLLWAGHETTKNLIGNAVVTLLRHPGQLAALRRDPALLSTAIEECLRFESPVQKVCRWSGEALEIGGRRIPEGRFVVGLIGAAHRDPARWEDPDRFDIRRESNGLLAFGRGAHHCLGAGLARLEARAALAGLLAGGARRELASPVVEWQEWTSFRGPRRLPMVLSS